MAGTPVTNQVRRHDPYHKMKISPRFCTMLFFHSVPGLAETAPAGCLTCQCSRTQAKACRFGSCRHHTTEITPSDANTKKHRNGALRRLTDIARARQTCINIHSTTLTAGASERRSTCTGWCEERERRTDPKHGWRNLRSARSNLAGPRPEKLRKSVKICENIICVN